MIEINVRNFCQNCRWFNPETTTIFVNDEPHTYVSCIYEEQCVRVCEMAKEQEQQELEEDSHND